MRKKQAVVLGATGAAGQNVVEFIQDHPWFEVKTLAASDRSHGVSYQEAIKGAIFFRSKPSEELLESEVVSVSKIDPMEFDVVFSALPSNIALDIEARFAKYIPVISTASAYRYDSDVPILIPEVNPDHIELIDAQRENREWSGYVVPGPNCTTVGLVMTLKPLLDNYGVNTVSMVSLQSLSGAGEKGLRSDSSYRNTVLNNVLPYIEGEEQKVEEETNKILGTFAGRKIIDASINIHATCTRVMVENVHTIVVHAGLKKTYDLNELKSTLKSFRSEPQEFNLPSAPEKPIIIVEDDYHPQPLKHREYPHMVTVIGRIRENNLFENGLSYVLTSDNLERGAGGGAVLTAEHLLKKGLI
jgi:aspartate-semialdehyde dehydrogenase